MDKPAGALVAQVLEKGPADKGGLQVGDVILSLDNHPVVMSADLPHLVGAVKPGDTVKLVVMREGSRKTLRVKVGALPNEGEEMAVADGSGAASKAIGWV